ncbi:MAG: hypothetical protein AMS26_23020, partial [Bacteroides sp. SM23_62]
MWPTLQQPWYFNNLSAVETDHRGNVYVVDSSLNRIQKYNSDGILITKWGSSGGNDGQFYASSGIAIDAESFIYVSDTNNHRIQKFTPDGQFVTKWGSEGSDDGQFDFFLQDNRLAQGGIATDINGDVYVADTGNNRIQKFDSDGVFIMKWGTEGSGEGQFNNPEWIAIDTNGNVYVADTGNNRIQKFDLNGGFITQWGTEGSGEGQFDTPLGIDVDTNGNVYVADQRNHRIQVFDADGNYIAEHEARIPLSTTSGSILAMPEDVAIQEPDKVYINAGSRMIQLDKSGTFIQNWDATSKNEDDVQWPEGIAIDGNGNIIVADRLARSIKQLNSDGILITEWAKYGEGNGVGEPIGIAINSTGEILVTDMYNDNIQKYTSDGTFVTQWGTWGTGDSEFIDPKGIAVDASGNIYVADTENHRVQKFNSNGVFITKWGSEGSDDSQFDRPRGIAADASGNIYVADTGNHRVQKFNSNGVFITKWGTFGLEDGDLYTPSGIAIDETGNVYVGNYGHVQIFDNDGTFISRFGEVGSEPGMFGFIHSVYVSSSGRVYTTDYSYKRIQVFKKVTVEDNSKAIILAGGGPYSGNNLWDATQLSANFAYRTLTYQGFTKETIYYLTSDTDLDLDGNGELDDVDADATNANLQNAILNWAADAENLVLYLVDHGGDTTFRMSPTETLSASDLDSWLDQLQDTTSAKVTVIYDACESGSFISGLIPPTEEERVVITSTSPGESAYFVTQGSVSFSNYFWTHIFNGLDIKDSFTLAKEAIGQSADYQHPLLDADGNGTGNETLDYTLADGAYIGNGTIIYGDAPVIGSVSDPQNIDGTSSAILSAYDVTDDDGIARVWAVIRPPDYSQGSPDNPVQNLPSIDLIPVGEDQYEGSYDGFNIEGTYSIAIYARDRIGNTAVPSLTTVDVNNPLKRRAIIVAGGSQSDEIWPAIEKNTKLVCESLSFQGYCDDDIYLMSPASIPGVTIMTVLPTLSNMGHAITSWAQESTQDLVLYMIGNGEYGTFDLNSSETLSAYQLDSWLDNLQANISGKVTIIYDASFSGSFLPSLVPPSGKERILISSSSSSQASYYISDGDISFSKFFWKHILNGMNVRDSFVNAKNAIYYCAGQAPQLDDNGNGISNEKEDGLISRYYSIGVGIMLAGDDPVIGSVSPGQTLYGSTSTTIWAEDITTTGTIDKVWAVISPPAYLRGFNSQPDTDLPTVELVDDGNGHYEGTYNDFSTYGNYSIAVYAMDTDGNVSLPKDTYVYQEIGPDLYEDDDSLDNANIIISQLGWEEMYELLTQRHNFHDEGDEDWVKFYGVGGGSYEIKTENLDANCDT